jgi:simple sugar transport system ATP-binding protein
VLILDEPTAVLVPQDVEVLFDSIRRLTGQGMGVLFISHKLGEVSRISHRVSVLRRGRIIATVPTAGASPAQLAEMMVGRPTVGVRRADRAAPADAGPLAAMTDAAAEQAAGLTETVIGPPGTASASGVTGSAVTGPPGAANSRPAGSARESLGDSTAVRGIAVTGTAVTVSAAPSPAGAVLAIRGLRLSGRGKDLLAGIDLTVAAGEILGLAGVSGNGQTELVQVLCGLARPTAGTVAVNGVDVTGADPERVIAAGLGRITEDRHACVVANLSVAQNLVLEDLPRFRRGPLLDRKAIRAHAERLIEQFSIKAKPDDPIGTLSGGNMQKVLLARTLARNPVALVASQPTRGLDVGATEFVHTELLARRAAGAGVLLVSEDLAELLALADRIVVIYEGALVGEMPADGADPEQLGLLMAGQTGAAA